MQLLLQHSQGAAGNIRALQTTLAQCPCDGSSVQVTGKGRWAPGAQGSLSARLSIPPALQLTVEALFPLSIGRNI